MPEARRVVRLSRHTVSASARRGAVVGVRVWDVAMCAEGLRGAGEDVGGVVEGYVPNLPTLNNCPLVFVAY